jgi:hypothetical protein
MTRGSRFSEKIIAFALTERSRGKRWKDIQNSIKQEFQISVPPTTRQMLNWYKEYGGSAIDQEKILREAQIRVVKDLTPMVAFATQQWAIQQIPKVEEARRKNLDPWMVQGVGLLRMFEQTVGSDLYDKVIEEYEQERKQRGTRFPQTW